MATGGKVITHGVHRFPHSTMAVFLPFALFTLSGWAQCYVAAQTDSAASCLSLKDRLKLEDTTILDVTHIAGPANVSTPGSCQSTAIVNTNICRVQFVIHTTSDSSVHAEAWLPDTWFGRFLGLGNGGLGGCMSSHFWPCICADLYQ